MITLGYKDHFWTIGLKWVNGRACFDLQWKEFVSSSGITVGETLTFRQSDTLDDPHSMKFKVAIFPPSLMKKDDIFNVADGNASYQRFYKVVTLNALNFEHLEIPRCFIAKYGDHLSNPIEILIGDGLKTTFMYSYVDRKIHGLNSFFEHYKIHENYVMIFDYLGRSNFRLEVYDSEYMNHFCTINGNYRFGYFNNIFCNEDNVKDLHNEVGHNSNTDEDSDSESFSEELEIAPGNNDNDEDAFVVLDKDPLSFLVVLSKCHVDGRCHGVDIGRDLFPIYSQLSRKSNITLIYGGRQWIVQALKDGRRCRIKR
ncbi:uncharacterized protein LOC141661461 [Apium graveolens]|uniref:uncharacterized protein LOC141661461 n=1 Tax=Apium graveolens TaxID=4045 RepID=UPI003D7C0AFC